MHHLHIMAKHAVSSFIISFSMSCKFFALLLSLANALVTKRLDFDIHKSKKNPRPSICLAIVLISIILIYCNQLNKNTFRMEFSQ